MNCNHLSEVSKELQCFVQYKDPKISYQIHRVWETKDGRLLAFRVYQNCFKCSVQRFTAEQMKKIQYEAHSFLCNPCSKEYDRVFSLQYYYPSFPLSHSFSEEEKEKRGKIQAIIDECLCGTDEKNRKDPLVKAKIEEDFQKELKINPTLRKIWAAKQAKS